VAPTATTPTESTRWVALMACAWGVVVHGHNRHVDATGSGDRAIHATLVSVDEGGLEHEVASDPLGDDHALDAVVCVSVLETGDTCGVAHHDFVSLLLQLHNLLVFLGTQALKGSIAMHLGVQRGVVNADEGRVDLGVSPELRLEGQKFAMVLRRLRPNLVAGGGMQRSDVIVGAAVSTSNDLRVITADSFDVLSWVHRPIGALDMKWDEIVASVDLEPWWQRCDGSSSPYSFPSFNQTHHAYFAFFF
jgi:hypothetical protein